MRESLKFIQIFAAVLLLAVGIDVYGQSSTSELESRVPVWEQFALTCRAGPYSFPSKQSGDSAQPCDDGDMTLFNGLLCASGDVRGCDGVRDALDSTSGLWHRSPRIRLLGKNDRGNADSSPDMALGIELYLLTTKDTDRAMKWFRYLDSQFICQLFCLVKLPKFCALDDCVLRPGDAAVLAKVVDEMQKNSGFPTLPDGPLRGSLGTFSGSGPIFSWIGSLVNKPGYSSHIAGVAIWVMRLAGEKDERLATSSQTLAERNPGNAFFSWLAGRPKDQIAQEVLSRCVADPKTLVQPLFQWQWERDNAKDGQPPVYAWQQSSLWDCIFMRNLVQKMQ